MVVAVSVVVRRRVRTAGGDVRERGRGQGRTRLASLMSFLSLNLRREERYVMLADIQNCGVCT